MLFLLSRMRTTCIAQKHVDIVADAAFQRLYWLAAGRQRELHYTRGHVDNAARVYDQLHQANPRRGEGLHVLRGHRQRSAAKVSLAIHLAINVASTAVLASSNFFVQVLNYMGLQILPRSPIIFSRLVGRSEFDDSDCNVFLDSSFHREEMTKPVFHAAEAGAIEKADCAFLVRILASINAN
ncbi:uncharacterized protein PG986_007539 [Apiospora aurea]|uniref:DUF6536 domain-containing protein n=1 Tax=Apiospora aurea TaxID=335848 RepID=A0ABR1QDM2_9PEZI